MLNNRCFWEPTLDGGQGRARAVHEPALLAARTVARGRPDRLCYVAARDIGPAYTMTRQLIVYCLGFTLGSALCATQYILIRLGLFRRNPYVGIALRVTRDSDDVWWRVHRAAAPWIGWAGLLAAFGALLAGSGLYVAVEPETADAFSIASAVFGYAGGAIYWLGVRSGHRHLL